MKNIVVSGADGFLGRHLISFLVNNDCFVFALVIQGSRNKKLLDKYQNVKVIECALNEVENISRAIQRDIDVFYHLAWNGVSPDTRESFDIQKVNSDLCLYAVRLARAVKAKRFIFPGSTMEYSFSNSIINEDSVPTPQNVYGVEKISCRYLCEVLCRKFGIQFNYVVLSSIYSEDRIDNNVIYYTISSLLKKKKPRLTNLTQLWDYVYIDDVVRGLYLVAIAGKAGAFYCIGHGDNCPLSDYIYKIRDLIDPSLPLGIGELEYTNSVVPMSCIDLSLLTRDTGFVPNISFEEGIRRVIDCLREKS